MINPMTIDPDKRTILVVDDEQDIVEELGEDLTRKGFHVLSAGDGPAALEIFAREVVDMVITDIIMPGMSGVEMIGNMHNLRPELPIIAVSGSARFGKESSLAKAEEAGAVCSLSKPLNLTDLYDCIHEFLPAGP